MNDIRLGLRLCLRHPVLSLAAIFSLALGIGANTAIFTVLRGSILSPLPFTNPERLVGLWETSSTSDHRSLAPANFADWRRLTTSFEGMAAYGNASGTLIGQGEAQRLRAVSASANLFDVLGVEPMAGRRMTGSDDGPGRSPVAMVTEGLARRLFGSPAAATGTALTVDGVTYTVVGVLGAPLELPDATDVEIWLSGEGGLPRSEAFPNGMASVRDSHFIRAIGRVRPGVSLADAEAQLDRVMDVLATQFPASNAGLGARLVPLRDDIVGDARSLVWILQAAVAVLLLVACANVAHLLLAQAAARRSELATRMALGAPRGRIVRQLLLESLVIAVPGGVAGIVLAFGGIRALLLAAPADLPRLGEASIDGAVLAFACLLTLATTVVFGLAPAWHAGGAGTGGLTAGVRGDTGSRTARRWHGVIATAELALAQLLLVAAGLLVASLAHANRIELGFATEGRLAAELNLRRDYVKQISANGDIDPAMKIRFVERVLDTLSRGPGVRTAAAGFVAPMTGQSSRGVRIAGDPEPPPNQQPVAAFQIVTPGYFLATGMTMVAGRVFAPSDTLGSPAVAVINQAFADRYFEGRLPIGRVLVFGDNRRHEIVGVVADARFDSVERAAAPAFFLPLHQNVERWGSLSLVVWSDEPSLSAPLLRAAVREADPLQPISRLGTFDELVSRSLAARRFNTRVVTVFAATVLILAAIGIYGVVAFAVSSRTREIGLRGALGASPAGLLRMVVAQGLRLTAVASAAGILAAVALTRFMAAMLFNVAPTDPLTIAAVTVVLAGVAIAATLAPARRAMTVNPVEALRD
ncbi:MAG: ABC transporter permease [Vicinamibacterales bacterium]